MNIFDLDIRLFEKNLNAIKKKFENDALILECRTKGHSYFERVYLNDPLQKECLYHLFESEYRIKPELEYGPYLQVKEEWIGKKVELPCEKIKGMITNIKEDTQQISVAGSWYSLGYMYQVANWGNNGDNNDGKFFGMEIVE